MSCIPCFAKRAGKIHTTDASSEKQAPRPAKLKSKSRAKPKERKCAFGLAKDITVPRLPVKQAHQKLVSGLAQQATANQAAAHAGLRTEFLMDKEQLSPDALVPVITDLDTVLFNNVLGDRIWIDWAKMAVSRRSMLRGISLPYDFSRSGVSKVRIRLNTAMFGVDDKEEIWGTVVHEMLHAYLDLTSNWAGLTKPHHGALFEESCRAIVERLDLYGLQERHVI